jgi:hypothetical protein
LRAFNNAADESLLLALGVKIVEKKVYHPIPFGLKVWLTDALLIRFIYVT